MYIRFCREIPVAVLLAALLTPLARGQEPSRQTKPRPVANRILVQFKPNVGANQIDEALARGHSRVLKSLPTPARKRKGQADLVVVVTDLPVHQAAAGLNSHPAVEFAEPDWIVQHRAVADDPYVLSGDLWGLSGSNSSPANIFGSGAVDAWAAGAIGSRNVFVGILDEGIQWQHPDLLSNVWTNIFERAEDGIDNDGNGYIDDVHGWNFCSGNNVIFTNGFDYHGTHVAGTIGAAGNNNQGVAGVNWRVTCIPVKFLGPDGGYTSDAIEAIDYLVDLKQRHGLNIVAINNSWGGSEHSIGLHNSFLDAAEAGILMVVAAGNGDAMGNGLNNDNVPDYPSNLDTTQSTATHPAASYNAVISVAALDKRGALAVFSNYGAQTVHLAAPGVSILSTVPMNSYSYLSGTSAAAPHVSGAIALYAAAHPGATANEIRGHLLATASSTASLVGKTTTGSRLDIAAFIGSPSGGSASGDAPTMESVRLMGNQAWVSIGGKLNQCYEIQASSDLRVWRSVTIVTNTSGTVEIPDPASSGSDQNFYRAVVR